MERAANIYSDTSQSGCDNVMSVRKPENAMYKGDYQRDEHHILKDKNYFTSPSPVLYLFLEITQLKGIFKIVSSALNSTDEHLKCKKQLTIQ